LEKRQNRSAFSWWPTRSWISLRVCYQTIPTTAVRFPSTLKRLTQLDWQMLERTLTATAIEKLRRFALGAWRDLLLEGGAVRSLLATDEHRRRTVARESF
jgi:hypothetical protein